ncbi:hypothetical protein [Corynebacterium confusum]|uniref:hypothetical protein n=1 Tax=Corynebacterium confusum TaxID=71254 RepID=UPI0025B5B2C0|nr:hypothetical protein [Corynebacterium confusum]WJY88763.1 hypothetical protein CCONF_00990 [Corynebacterium confusum]
MNDARFASPASPSAAADSADGHRQPHRFRSGLAALVVLVLLAACAGIAAAVGMSPEKAWNSADSEEGVTGAPAADAPAGIDPNELVDARRATGEAQSQAGFLKSGTQQLADGTGQLKDRTGEITGGVDQLSQGTQELVDGLVQLQAGTGQLGAGATELADGVGQAVDQITGIEVVRGQILTAIDGALGDLRGNDSADAKKLRGQLKDLRGQVDTFKIDESITGELNRLKDGSRELSNELAVPGYAYHDGIYSATEGAKQLNAAIGELDGGADEAVNGINELDEGARKIDGMADQNKTKVESIQRAMPPVQFAADGQDAGPSRLLAPVVAMLIAALVMLGGIGLGWLSTQRGRLSLLGGLVGLVAAGEVALFVLAAGLTAAAAAISAGVFALAAVTAAVVTRALMGLLGRSGGMVAAAILGIVQVGVVGWFWKSVAASDAPTYWQVIANLLPLNWATNALTVVGNGGQQSLLWMSLGVLAAVAVIGGAGVWWASRSSVRPARA